GVAAGRLDDGRVLVDLAVALAGVDHRDADAVLYRPQRVEILQLGDDGGPGVAHHAAEPDQRRRADCLGDVVVDAAAEGGGGGAGPRVRHVKSSARKETKAAAGDSIRQTGCGYCKKDSPDGERGRPHQLPPPQRVRAPFAPRSTNLTERDSPNFPHVSTLSAPPTCR